MLLHIVMTKHRTFQLEYEILHDNLIYNPAHDQDNKPNIEKQIAGGQKRDHHDGHTCNAPSDISLVRAPHSNTSHSDCHFHIAWSTMELLTLIACNVLRTITTQTYENDASITIVVEWSPEELIS